MVPLGVAGFVAQRAVSNLLQERDRSRVTLATPGVLAVYGGRIGTMPDRVSAIAADADFKRYLVGGDTAGLGSVLRRALARQTGTPLSFAVVADAHGNAIADVRGQPEYLPGVAPPSFQEMLATDASPASPRRADLLLNRTIVPVVSANGSATVGTLVAGDYLDNTFAQSLQSVTGVDVTIVVEGQAVATSLPVPPGSVKPWTVPIRPAGGAPVRATIGGRTVDAIFGPLVGTVAPGSAALVTSTPLTSQANSPALIASI